MQAGSPGPPGVRRRADRVAGVVIAAVGGCIAWVSQEYPFGTLAEPGPGFLPFCLALIFALFGVVLAVAGGRCTEAHAIEFGEWRHVVTVLAALAASAFAIERIGFRALVLALLLFFLVVVERRNPFVAAAVAAAAAFGTFHLVNDVLRVPLPLGPWGY